jgi:hypothetical protein
MKIARSSGTQVAQDGSLVYTSGRLGKPCQNCGSHIRSDGQIGHFSVESGLAGSASPVTRPWMLRRILNCALNASRILDEAVTEPQCRIRVETHQRSLQQAPPRLFDCLQAGHRDSRTRLRETGLRIDPEAVLEAEHVEWSGQPSLRWGMAGQRIMQALGDWKPR